MIHRLWSSLRMIALGPQTDVLDQHRRLRVARHLCHLDQHAIVDDPDGEFFELAMTLRRPTDEIVCFAAVAGELAPAPGTIAEPDFRCSDRRMLVFLRRDPSWGVDSPILRYLLRQADRAGCEGGPGTIVYAVLRGP